MSLFSLSVADRRIVESIPPPLTEPVQLENRLKELQYIQADVFHKMRSRTVTLMDRARYQKDLILVNSAIETTVLRLRFAGARSTFSPR